MRKTRQKQPEKISLSLLFRLTRRTVLFLFLFLSVLVLFYAIGNYQFFLDSNQIIILNTAVIVSAALFLISSAGIIEAAFCIAKKNKKRLYYSLNLIVMIMAALSGVLCMFFLSATLIISKGI